MRKGQTQLGQAKMCKVGHDYIVKGIGCPKCRNVRQARYRAAHPEHTTKVKMDWHNRNPEKRRASKRKYKYGLTSEQYDSLAKDQNYLCRICTEEEVKVVDHCHATNRVRGLLCYKCNNLLGMAKDNTNILLSAVEYLKG